jgi:hypothetical protein
MGTFEIINAAVSLGLGAVMTIWAQALKDAAERQRMLMERYTAGEQSIQAARNHEAPWKGFYWVRSAIAVTVVIYFFLVPVIALCINGVQVVVGYYDVTQGFWPWSSDFESVTWIKAGAAEPLRVLVYDPVRNNVLISIISMYFGNQFARRA